MKLVKVYCKEMFMNEKYFNFTELVEIEFYTK